MWVKKCRVQNYKTNKQKEAHLPVKSAVKSPNQSQLFGNVSSMNRTVGLKYLNIQADNTVSSKQIRRSCSCEFMCIYIIFKSSPSRFNTDPESSLQVPAAVGLWKKLWICWAAAWPTMGSSSVGAALQSCWMLEKCWSRARALTLPTPGTCWTRARTSGSSSWTELLLLKGFSLPPPLTWKQWEPVGVFDSGDIMTGLSLLTLHLQAVTFKQIICYYCQVLCEEDWAQSLAVLEGESGIEICCLNSKLCCKSSIFQQIYSHFIIFLSFLLKH